MATFGNVLQVGSSCMEVPNVHITCWTICCASKFDLYMSWITLSNGIFVKLSMKYSTLQSSPQIKIVNLPIEYALEFNPLFAIIWPFIEGNLLFLLHCEKKTIMGPPTNRLSCVDEILFLNKRIQNWNHVLNAFSFTPIRHTNIHNIWFICWKKQHDVVLWQVIVKTSRMVYYKIPK